MSGLLVVAAFAQATTATGTATTPTTAPVDGAAAPHVGTSTYLDAEAAAGYSTNPFLSPGNHTGQGFGRISLNAVHTRVSDRTTTVFSAYAQDTTYTGRYGSEQSFAVHGRHDAAVNEHFRVFVDGDAAYDKGGQLDTRILVIPNVPLLPGTLVPPVLLPPGADFLAVTGRSYHADLNAGAQLTLAPRDSLDFSAGVDHTVFKGTGVDTRFTTIPLSLGFDHELSERTTLGARVVGNFTHYSQTVNNPSSDVRVITPEVTGEFKLSPTVTLSGDVGASFSKVDNPLETRHSTGLAADAILCSKGEFTLLCARASIQEQAATSAGPARLAALEVDYSRRLNATDSIDFSLAANRYSNPIIIVSGQQFTHATYVRAAADYSRSIGHRWFAGVNVAARKVTERGPSPDADLSASVFIRYRFGDLQ